MSSSYCPYCLPDTVAGPFDVEHVIPAKLGGTLEIRTHKKCNGGAASAIDNPLMADPDVEMLRALSGAHNTRTKRHRGAQFAGHLQDDAKALLRATSGGVIIEQVTSSEPQVNTYGTFTYSLPVKNSEAHSAKLLERLRRENPGKTVELVGSEPRRGHVSIERSWHLAPWVWPRFAAKVALGVCSLVMPPEWRGSPGELFLLALFRAGTVIGAAGGLSAVPTPLFPGDPFFDYLYPWEHVVYVTTTSDAVSVSLVLFGELRYDLGVVSEIRPASEAAWVCDYRERKPDRFGSISDLALAITERAAMFGDVRDLHLERPRAELIGPREHARLSETPLDQLRTGNGTV